MRSGLEVRRRVSALRSGPAALAPGVRPATVAGAALAVVALVVLGVRYANGAVAGRLDGHLSDAVDNIPAGRGGIAGAVIAAGDPIPVMVIAAFLAAVSLAAGRRRLAMVAIVGPGLTGIATSVLKPIIGRTIDNGLAFPSGHTGAATALGLVAAMLVVSLLRVGHLPGLLLLGAGAVAPGAGMALALTALDIHYPTDTVGGLCTAVVAVIGTARIVDHIAERRAEPTRPGRAARRR